MDKIINKGDIVCIDSSIHTENAQFDQQQAIVLSSDEFHKEINMVLVCPISSSLKTNDFEISLPESLGIHGAAKCDQIKFLNDLKERKVTYITKLSDDFVSKIMEKTRLVMDRYSDDEILKMHENNEFPLEHWTHRSHVRLAWIVSKQFSHYDDALSKLRHYIKSINRRIEQDRKKPAHYCESLTNCYLRVIHNRVWHMNNIANFVEFCGKNTDILDRKNPLSFKYYKKESLHKPPFCEVFVEPDLNPLP